MEKFETSIVGGVRAEVFYLDADGAPAEKDVAVGGEAIGYDENGNMVQRTYFTIGQPAAQE
jgi:hypothetical protein